MVRTNLTRAAGLLLTLVTTLAGGIGCAAGHAGLRVARSTAHFPSDRGFVRREILVDGQPRDLWVFIPRNYNSSHPMPAIVFLHGLFEAGSNGTGALAAGLGPVIARDPDNWPFIVLFPQSDGTWRGERRERLVMQSLDWAERELAIDRGRVILAGLSYGGLGAWQIGANHADRFAAIVPVSGRRDFGAAPRLSRVPVWAFHSRGDLIIPADASEAMCEAIAAHGGQPRLTVFNAIDHDCWDRAVGQSDLVAWMLAQRKDAPIVSASAAD